MDNCFDDELLLREMIKQQPVEPQRPAPLLQQQPQVSGGSEAEEPEEPAGAAFRAVPVTAGHGGRNVSALLTPSWTNPWAAGGEAAGGEETQEEGTGGGTRGGGVGRPRRRRVEQRPPDGKDLRRAATHNRTQELESLVVTSQVPLDAADAEGKQPLHYAARAGAIEAVRVLLELRADPNAADKWGTKPVDEAEYWSVKPREAEGARLHHQKYCDALAYLYDCGGTRSDPRGRSDAHMVIARLKRAEESAAAYGLPVPWPALTGTNTLPIGWAEAREPCLALPPPQQAEPRGWEPEPVPPVPAVSQPFGAAMPLHPPRPQGPPPQQEQPAHRPQQMAPPAQHEPWYPPPPPPPPPAGPALPGAALPDGQDMATILALKKENLALKKENRELRVRLFIAEQAASKINGGDDSGKGV